MLTYRTFWYLLSSTYSCKVFTFLLQEGGNRKGGSVYRLMFLWDFGVRRKDLKGEEPSVIFLKSTSYQNHHVFHVFICPRRLARQSQELWTSPMQSSLGGTNRYYYGWEVLSEQGCTGQPLFSHSLRETRFETRWWSSNVRGNGSSQHETAALQSLVTNLHVEPETMGLSQIKSHLSGGDNQAFYSCGLGENSNGNDIERLLSWGLSFQSTGGFMFSAHVSAYRH